MSNKIYLSIDGVVLPVEPKRGYDLKLDDSESVNETEAGTFIRSVQRSGIPSIKVSFWCNREMLVQMRGFRDATSVTVNFYDPVVEEDSEGNRLVTELMYVTGYQESMLADTEDGGFWSVKFDLEDLSYV